MQWFITELTEAQEEHDRQLAAELEEDAAAAAAAATDTTEVKKDR
jgi:hypothetical protein